jgi:hypothetical protein
VLFESHTDPISLTPDDIARKRDIVALKDDVETLRNILGVSNLNRRARNAHVADQAIHRTVSELNLAGHQYRFARCRASFHENFFASKLMGREYAFPV